MSDECGCRKCNQENGISDHAIFVVCETCGNKRCPKATDHDLECTNSNKSGQTGSVYQY